MEGGKEREKGEETFRSRCSSSDLMGKPWALRTLPFLSSLPLTSTGAPYWPGPVGRHRARKSRGCDLPGQPPAAGRG